jgi:hypothetical protein
VKSEKCGNYRNKDENSKQNSAGLQALPVFRKGFSNPKAFCVERTIAQVQVW